MRRHERTPSARGSRLIAPSLVALVALAPSRALATEHQTFVGGTVGYGHLDEHYQWLNGFGTTAEVRHGLNDAIDLEVDASLYAYPTGRQIVPAASVGVVYVLDTLRVIPQVGATFGFHDLFTYACPKDARPCGHETHPSFSIPAAIDLRLTRHISFGAHFRYSFLLPILVEGALPVRSQPLSWSPLLGQITFGGALAFSTAP